MVFRGEVEALVDALGDAFAEPYSVAPPEGGAIEPEIVPAAISISHFKLDSPAHVACLSIRYQIAQKIHACTELPDEGEENQRFWDVIDLLLLRPLVPDRLIGVRDACEDVFETRNQHAWPPELVVYTSWREPFAQAFEVDLHE